MELSTDLIEPIRIIRRKRTDTRGGVEVIPVKLRTFKLHWLLELSATTAGTSVAKIMSADRRAKRTAARHLYMWLAHRFTAHSYASIGKLVMRVDHTTVRHGVSRVQKIVDLNKEHMPTDGCSPEAWAAAVWSVWGYDSYISSKAERKQVQYMRNRDRYRRASLARYRAKTQQAA